MEVAKVVFLAQILIDRRSNEHAQYKRPTDRPKYYNDYNKRKRDNKGKKTT